MRRRDEEEEKLTYFRWEEERKEEMIEGEEEPQDTEEKEEEERESEREKGRLERGEEGREGGRREKKDPSSDLQLYAINFSTQSLELISFIIKKEREELKLSIETFIIFLSFSSPFTFIIPSSFFIPLISTLLTFNSISLSIFIIQ
jgi:hypothetical protein